jgi:hypothetical protein
MVQVLSGTGYGTLLYERNVMAVLQTGAEAPA